MSHNMIKLSEFIIENSVSKTFHEAVQEWVFTGFSIINDWTKCPCGQNIKEQCFLENTENGKEIFVGNVCVNRFMKIETGNVFSGLKRIKKNIEANASKSLIRYAKEFGYIYESEFKFLMDTRMKRKLSEKQLKWKVKINNRILKKVIVSKEVL